MPSSFPLPSTGLTVNGMVTLAVAPRAVAGTAQVSVVPSWVTPVGRTPTVASSRRSVASKVIVVPAGMATLPVLRAERV